MTRTLLPLLSALLLFLTGVQAQFQFFEQMFNGQQQQQQRPEPQNVPSDSSWYQKNYDTAHCSNYLCPDTLACVAVPHHCPCAHPTYEEKFELADGKAICISKGGFKEGEAARKVELARKGLL
ncbi:hypothetical protein HYFRA_00013116 [Hymenoscyphus fraxineus]|uniref:Long chronological lifespan protein 2 n=1 Tax=Hymenoscyphus fraxineus TaxID=746836 RepID=A0A9N9PXH8_9HELO|nr:hypothetical protein HYFRA_00013116 [Hymenoscyphus fraxineus]